MSPLYDVPDTQKYFIIGKRLSVKRVKELGIASKIGKGEVAIEIPKVIIDEMER